MDNRPVESRIDIPICVAVFTLIVATTAVSLRIYTRKVLINQLGIDDYCAIAALLLVFSCDFAVTYNTNYGLGRHIWDVSPENIPSYLRTFYVSILFYNASLMAIKMTFLTQYYRIFQHTSKNMIMMFAGACVFVGCWAVSQLLIAIFTCHPIDGYWDQTKKSVCVAQHPFWEINAAGNIVTDVVILTLPIPMLERLNLPKRQRHILMGIFSLGIFTVCISLIRIRFLHQYEDFTWENVESSGWSMGELASGLTCACLPTLRPLIGHYVPWMSTNAGSYPRKNSAWTEKDTERGDTRHTGGSSSGGDVRPAPLRRTTTDWPLPADGGTSTPGVFVAAMQRMDSGGDTSDGILGLRATRDGLESPVAGPTSPVPMPPLVGGSSARPSFERRSSARPSLERRTSARPSFERLPSAARPSLDRQPSARPSIERQISARPSLSRRSSSQHSVGEQRPGGVRSLSQTSVHRG